MLASFFVVICIDFDGVFCSLYFFFFKQNTAYRMRISDWSSDVCSSDLNGWRIANSSLAHERSGVAAGSVELVAQLENLFELADGEAGQAARDRLGRLATHVRVTDAMAKAVQSHMLAGTDDASDAPPVKIFFSETNLAMTELGMELQGADGIAVEGDAGVAQDGWWQDAFLYARAYTIAGGSNGVPQNVVAERAP